MNLFFDICKYMALGFICLFFGLLFALAISIILALIFQEFNLGSVKESIILYSLPVGILISIGIYKLIND